MNLQRMFESYLAGCVKMTFAREKPTVIGIAGSVGKTSTRAAVGIALAANEPGSGVAMSDKNFNNDLGVPLVIFDCAMPRKSPFKWLALLAKAGLTALGLFNLRAKTFALELGTDRPGDLYRLMKMVKPQIGVFTAVGPEHTEFFGDVEGVAKEEAAIVAMLPKDGTMVFNIDDLKVHEICDGLDFKRVTFGLHELADVKVKNLQVSLVPSSPESSGLDIVFGVQGLEKRLRLTGTIGRPQAYATAAALAVVMAVDGDVDAALERLARNYHGMPGRMRLVPGIKKTWLIDDTYNSSPLASLSALDDLEHFPVPDGGRRFAALGDMLELGSLAEEAHEDMGRTVAESGVDLLVVCGTLAHVTAKGAKAAGMPEESIVTFAKSSEAGLFIQDRLHENDVVLIKGSQGSRMERITKELMARPDLAEKMLVRHTPDWLARS